MLRRAIFPCRFDKNKIILFWMTATNIQFDILPLEGDSWVLQQRFDIWKR